MQHETPHTSFSPNATFLSEPVSLTQVVAFRPPQDIPPTLLYVDGSLYYGDVDPINRVPHGLGIMLFKFQELSAGVSAQAIKKTDFTSMFTQGDRYGGYWVDGFFSGDGVLISGTCTYAGSWNCGKPHGKGTMQYGKNYSDKEEGNKGLFAGAVWRGLSQLSPFDDVGYKPQEYSGDFHRDHHRHGEGRMRYYNGDVYEGTWIDNCRNGFGKYRSMDGEEYEGHWLNDQRHGRGTIRYADGSSFKGVIENNKRQGPGVLRFSNGDEYSGDFRENNIEGQGVMKYRNGDVYEGEWKDGRRHGQGKYTLKKTGATMKGTFMRGLIHGKGTVELPGVSVFSGTFTRGIRSEGSMYWLDGADGEYRTYLCYQGEWKGEQMQGKGLLWFRDGGFYFGDFFQSKRDGKGNMRYANGEEYSGAFSCNAPHGWGVWQACSGKIRAGLWCQGKLLEGYVGEWNGSTIHGIGHFSIAANRLLSSRKGSPKPTEGVDAHLSDRATPIIEFYGVFENGSRHGPGILKLPAIDNTVWGGASLGRKNENKNNRVRQHVIKGTWKNNKLDCPNGVWVFPTGEVYIGAFSDDRREDQRGKLWLADGSVYIGGWQNDAPSGKGTFFSNNAKEPIYHVSPVMHQEVKETASEASKAPTYSGVDYIMGLFRSTAKDPKKSIQSMSTKDKVVVGYEQHHVLMGSWQQRCWSTRKCERLVSPMTSQDARDLLPAQVRANSSLSDAMKGMTVWLDGPDSTSCIQLWPGGETFDFVTKPPNTFSIGKVEGDVLILFPSGIVALQVYTSNAPQLVIPHRPLSLYDRYLSHLVQLNGQSHQKTLSSPSPPSYCSILTSKLLTVDGLHPVPVWETWKSVSFDEDNGMDYSTIPHPTQCSFCKADYSFFRRETACTLCFRSSCSSCLQSLESELSPSVAHLIAFSNRLNRRMRDEKDDTTSSNNDDSSSVQGVHVCADCAVSVAKRLTTGVVWLPLHIFSTVMQPTSSSNSASDSAPFKSNSSPHSVDKTERPSVGSEGSADEIFTPKGAEIYGTNVEFPIGIPECLERQVINGFVVYAGYLSGGIPHIFGEMWWGDESYYVGPFKEGVRSGFGYQVLRNGEVYGGFFEQNEWNGMGTYFFTDGTVLVGIFKDGQISSAQYYGEANGNLKRHGVGIGYEDNGTVYNGEWENGMKHGQGTLHYRDGSRFIGSFHKDRIEGEGKLITGSSVYCGSFLDGKKHGRAVEFFSSCAVEGTWVGDATEGLCRIFDKESGDVYETTYLDGNERDDCFVFPEEAKDEEALACLRCQKAFHILLRRHHCRLCGGIFCDYCTKYRAVLPAHFPFPSGSLQRVCEACFQRQEQRRTIAIKRYGSGEVYAGCWSQGRWVSNGLWSRPDGLFVVMDENGVPIHSTMSRSPAVRASVCRDAAPARKAFHSLTESSPIAALENFLEWWEKARKDCNLSVPLFLSIAVNYRQYSSHFQNYGSRTVLVGSHDASLLAEISVPSFPYPTLPATVRHKIFKPGSSGGFQSPGGGEKASSPVVDIKYRVIQRILKSASEPPYPPDLSSCFPATKLCRSGSIAAGNNTFFSARPNMEHFDIDENEMREQIQRFETRNTISRPPSLFVATPPNPAFGSDDPVRWEAWFVKPLPFFVGGAEDIGRTEGHTNNLENHFFDFAQPYACPFWRSEVIDFQKVLELGKVQRAREMMLGAERAGEGVEALSTAGWLPGRMTAPLDLSKVYIPRNEWN